MWEKSLSAKQNYTDRQIETYSLIYGWFVLKGLPSPANLPCKEPRCIFQAIANNSFERCFQITKKVISNKMANCHILIIAI